MSSSADCDDNAEATPRPVRWHIAYGIFDASNNEGLDQKNSRVPVWSAVCTAVGYSQTEGPVLLIALVFVFDPLPFFRALTSDLFRVEYLNGIKDVESR